MSLFTESLSLVLFVAGAMLLVAEALAPGAHFFVVGVALLTAGIVGLLVPGGTIVGPLILAGVVIGVTAITLWGYRTLDIYGGEGAARTKDSDSLRGSFGYVTERVTRHDGEVKLNDGGFNPYYRARTEDGDIEEGEEIMVVDPGGGNVVTVTPVASHDNIERELEKGREAADREAESDDLEADADESTEAESDAGAESATGTETDAEAESTTGTKTDAEAETADDDRA